ncbi:unnamed protein product [Lepeophtheirus salmonis]|uniref:(salmon louse) hypothetical protein n=1 Tax=Lepeophtheirus salmonis TaxID=72036 RepID=A0A7R8CUU4_LEPSM|nr:unnamed protein product [Lepeophtheirus salmonis]CAF2901980.1 unnamed protein product [Lepeophtheirus salmonis]
MVGRGDDLRKRLPSKKVQKRRKWRSQRVQTSRQVFGTSSAAHSSIAVLNAKKLSEQLPCASTVTRTCMSNTFLQTKVKPLKVISIPRMELEADVTASKLDGLDDSFCIVLNRTLETYIANRLQNIGESVNPNCCKHVSGHENPTDIAIGGVLPKEFVRSKIWMKGPMLLSHKCEISRGVANQDDKIELEREEKKWKLIPPRAPNQGVAWETLAEFTKSLLNRHFRLTSLNNEEMTQIEAALIVDP